MWRTWLGVIVIAGILSSIILVEAAEDLNIAGHWNTTNGPVTITRTSPGQYSVAFDKYPGKASGAVTGDIFLGRWSEIAKVKRCATEMDGSPYWGGFRVQFHGPPKLPKRVFQGIWMFCELDVKPVQEGANWAGEITD